MGGGKIIFVDSGSGLSSSFDLADHALLEKAAPGAIAQRRFS